MEKTNSLIYWPNTGRIHIGIGQIDGEKET